MTATKPHPNLGCQQSPIVLERSLEAKDLGVSITWDALILEAKDDGYCPSRKLSAQATKKGGVLILDGESYVPIDFHWHFPSEHVLPKKGFAAEVHIVHIHEDHVAYAKQGKLDWCKIAVIGVFLEEGAPGYPPMDVAADKDKREYEVARSKLLPRNRTAIRYEGSLTTPPYSENVTFIVFENTVTATKAQLKDQKLPNARETQALNRRYCIQGKVTYKK